MILWDDLRLQRRGTKLELFTDRVAPSNWFRKQAIAAGLPDICRCHGLRKAAARRLAEAGCTAPQNAPDTGHKSLREIERYIKDAAQIGLADAAIEILWKTEIEQKLSNPEGRLDKSRAK